MGTRRIAPAVALAMILVACGSGESADTTTTPASTEATTTTSAATTVTTTAASTTTTTVAQQPASAYMSTIQSQLKALGYFEGAIDGIPGPLTEEALRAFQKDAGITVDGEAGPETEAALAEDLMNDPEFVENVIQKGLMELGLYPGPADGKYGKGTKAAVERLQTDCDLEPDGIFEVFTQLCMEDKLRNA